MKFLHGLWRHLAEQEIAVLIAYGISGSVFVFGGIVMFLLAVGLVDLGFGPTD